MDPNNIYSSDESTNDDDDDEDDEDDDEDEDEDDDEDVEDFIVDPVDNTKIDGALPPPHLTIMSYFPFAKNPNLTHTKWSCFKICRFDNSGRAHRDTCAKSHRINVVRSV